jgi:hypothetical protein
LTGRRSNQLSYIPLDAEELWQMFMYAGNSRWHYSVFAQES